MAQADQAKANMRHSAAKGPGIPPATLAHHGRAVLLHLADKNPWATLVHDAITRLRALAVPG